jgi:hypothetical protein
MRLSASRVQQSRGRHAQARTPRCVAARALQFMI